MFFPFNSRYRNNSVEEIFRVENTSNYESKTGDAIKLKEIKEVNIDEVGILGSDGEYIDEKGIFAAISPSDAPAVLTWNNVSVSTKARRGKEPKTILNNMSGCISGGLWAIMGASGSGKTTFLSVLSLRLDTNRMKIEGDIRINGKTYTKNLLKTMSGYVMQDDLIHAMLTVQETLMYTAALRMPNTCLLPEREARCDECLKTMGIEYCRDVIVGDTRNKGISGGERKRLCVAMELITKPKLLFLDEPTSGLDSTTALSLMHTMKDLVERGECTVVCTIHQPQTKIFNIIDNLLLMKMGEIVYQGACAKAEQYFAEAGYPCPDKMNPADHMLDCVTMGNHDEKEAAHIARLAVPINMDFGIELNDFSARAVQPWTWQLLVLTHRNLMEKVRRWDIIAMNIFITIIIAIFIGGGAWQNIGNYADSVPKRNAIMFFTVIHQGVVSSLQGTYAFPMERAIMLRERQAGENYLNPLNVIAKQPLLFC
jgi:ATP-binding cassette subfamily G (WHITE) protein 2